MSGTLIHKQSDLVTRDQLRAIPTPAATATWRPIAHIDLVTAIERELGTRRLAIKREEFAVQHQGARLFGVLDLTGDSRNDFAAAMGLRHANDRSMAVEIAVGVRVFVCDNLAFSGDLIALKRKHTSGFDVGAEIHHALDRYQRQLTGLHASIDEMKATPLSGAQAKSLIVDVFCKAVLPVRFFKPVCTSYFHPADEMTDVIPRTRWALHNAFTRAIRALPPAVAFRATTDLGKCFGLRAGGES